jgi:integrase
MSSETGYLYRTAGSPFWWMRYRGPKRADRPRGDYRDSTKIVACGTDPTAPCVDRCACRKKALAQLREKRRQYANYRAEGRAFPDPKWLRRSVGDLLDNLLASYETRHIRSLRQVRAHMEHVKRLLGGYGVADISDRLDWYIQTRRSEAQKAETTIEDATLDRELELLRPAYDLVRLGDLAPIRKKLVRGNDNARTGFVNREQFEALVAQLPSELLQDIARFAYATGMRRESILTLTWDGYDADSRTLRLHPARSKNGKPVTIVLGRWPMLDEVISRRVAARVVGSALIFHNGRGGHVGDFYTSWRRAAKRAKIGAVTIHDFRRSAVRNMVRAGVPETVAMAISGHKTRAIFDRYDITDEKDLADAMVKRARFEGA